MIELISVLVMLFLSCKRKVLLGEVTLLSWIYMSRSIAARVSALPLFILPYINS